MNGYLLDTHTLLWWADQPSLISDQAKRIVESGHTQVYTSIVSAWEVAIKQRLGKLFVPMTVEQIVERGKFLLLPVNLKHVAVLSDLPLLHSDPFDRMLVAQAMAENLTLITRDEAILRYPISTVRA